jgi:DNA ligase 1
VQTDRRSGPLGKHALILLVDVATASGEVAGTSSRSRTVTILADLLRRLEADETPITVGFLSGVPRQGRIGVGYSTIYAVDHARG